jgi:membrane-associated protease RseP (regulator of RpoE activity)
MGTIVGRVDWDRGTPPTMDPGAAPSIVISRGGEQVDPRGHEAARVSLLPASYVITARLSLNPQAIPGTLQIATRLVVGQHDGPVPAEDRNDSVTFFENNPATVNLTFIVGAHVSQPTFARLLISPFDPQIVIRVYRAVIAAVVVNRLIVS